MIKSQETRRNKYWPTVSVVALLGLSVSLLVYQLFYSEKIVIILPNEILQQLEELQLPYIDENILNQEIAPSSTTQLIEKMEFIVPKKNNLCTTDNPWLMGENIIKQDDFLSAQDCYAIRFVLRKDARVMLLAYNESKTIYNISFKSCDVKNSTLIKANEIIIVPPIADGKKSVFFINQNTEEDSYYLVAFSQSFDIQKQLPVFSRVISDCGEVSDTSGVDFLQLLKNIKKRQLEYFDWRRFRFYH